MTVVSVAVTAAGRRLAARLPWARIEGPLAETVPARWADVDGMVLFAATGAAVRVVAPLLGDKATDPAVVCVDETGRWAVALCGGHQAGANDLARSVAAMLGATPVVTTATDAAGLPPLDALAGLRCGAGEVAAVTRALLDGDSVHLDNPLGWPLPDALADRLTTAPAPLSVTVTDRAVSPGPGAVILHPPSIIVGVGASSGAPAGELADLASAALADAGLATASIAAVATLDRKGEEPAIVALAASWDVPIQVFDSAALTAVPVPTPSPQVEAAVGTPSVAEAAALLASGAGASLVAAKRRSAAATVAIARRARPAGCLAVVGLGPGGAWHRTPAATAAVRHAEVVIGYGPYVDQAADAIGPSARVVRSPIGSEAARASAALTGAAEGRRVALVCSGDAGVYAMASLVHELAAEHPGVEVTVVPGVTAALAAAAALGSPLGHDHVTISLSDLLTPWSLIERRLRAAADADLVVSLYNPRSAGRDWQLEAACRILATGRAADTPVGLVTDAGRPGQRVEVTTLKGLDPAAVGMTTCVIIGSSTTRVIAGRMVTPRGYGGRP